MMQGGRSAGTPSRRADRPNLDSNAASRTIHVHGFPPYTQPQDLIRVFSQFGNAKVEKLCNNKFAYLTFPAEKEANAAIQANKKVNIYGEFLTIKPYNAKVDVNIKQILSPKRDFTRSKQKGVIIDPKRIDLSGDFHLQLDRILTAVRLTQEEATAISSLYADLDKVLQAQWPGCIPMPFGSITTGLGIKTSDADCFVKIPARFHHANANFITRAKRILQSHPQLFAEILSIPRANTPIVKFFHIPTETNCDLSFKTALGAQNSKLISFLLQTDPRLIPLAVLIKYWAKVHGISGTGKLTNYALTMLIIFYLQQSPMTILPSVEWLQRQQGSEVIVDFWNTGFMDNKQLLPPTSNTSSISELLGGFFEYYSSFNFEEMVVCPYLGVPIKKAAFADLNQLPNEFQRYKENVSRGFVPPMRFGTPMCVQDPFEQCHNVASAISNKMTADIKAYIKFAANAYDKEKLSNCQEFLKIILLQKPKIVKMKTHPEFRVNLFPRVITGIVDPDWKKVVRDVVFKTFENMLKLKLNKVNETETENEKKKVNPETKKEKEKYTSTLTKAIWKRKQFNRLYSFMQLEFEERQRRITEDICDSDKNMINLQFLLTMTFAQDSKTAVIAVKLTSGEPEIFRDFGKFYLSMVQNWFVQLLRPYSKITGGEVVANVVDTNNLDSTLDSDDDTDKVETVNSSNGPECDSDKDSAVPCNSKDLQNSNNFES